MRLLAAVTVLLATACGPNKLQVSMKSDNNSGQVGFATLEDRGEAGMRVTVETTVPITGDAPQLAHIHEGTCGEVGIIRVGLNMLNKVGEMRFGSTTDVDLRFEDLKTGPFNINAHDATDPTVYVSCGEIPTP
ncbi:MAG: hypothetical protein ACO1OB_20345 [Archangium sp.]